MLTLCRRTDSNARDENGSPKFASHETICIRANELVTQIHDQGSFAGSCLDRLSPNERVVVVDQIGTYAMDLVARLMKLILWPGMYKLV